jgi:hypothetical protein
VSDSAKLPRGTLNQAGIDYVRRVELIFEMAADRILDPRMKQLLMGIMSIVVIMLPT